jgi:hypothetical protein
MHVRLKGNGGPFCPEVLKERYPGRNETDREQGAGGSPEAKSLYRKTATCPERATVAVIVRRTLGHYGNVQFSVKRLKQNLKLARKHRRHQHIYATSGCPGKNVGLFMINWV